MRKLARPLRIPSGAKESNDKGSILGGREDGQFVGYAAGDQDVYNNGYARVVTDTHDSLAYGKFLSTN